MRGKGSVILHTTLHPAHYTTSCTLHYTCQIPALHTNPIPLTLCPPPPPLHTPHLSLLLQALPLIA